LLNQNSSKSSFYYGGAAAMRYMIEFFSSPVLGTIADVKGRKGVLLLSFLSCATEFFLLALAPSIPMLFVARAISGLGDVGASTTYTIVTDIATYNG
jgi:DHA1 family tetracycline resistance protein-like MFS transporter